MKRRHFKPTPSAAARLRRVSAELAAEELCVYGGYELEALVPGARAFLDGVGGMGFGTALGAVGGGLVGHFVGRRVSVDVDAKGTLSIPPLSSVRYAPVLVNRAVSVGRMFATRSHARRGDAALHVDASAIGAGALAKLTRCAVRCSRNPEWSTMGPDVERGADRSRTIDEVADVVRPLLHGNE